MSLFFNSAICLRCIIEDRYHKETWISEISLRLKFDPILNIKSTFISLKFPPSFPSLKYHLPTRHTHLIIIN